MQTQERGCKRLLEPGRSDGPCHGLDEGSVGEGSADLSPGFDRGDPLHDLRPAFGAL